MIGEAIKNIIEGTFISGIVYGVIGTLVIEGLIICIKHIKESKKDGE